MKMNHTLSNIYFDPSHSAGFTSLANLKKAVKGKYNTDAVKKWLGSQDAYTLHKPIKRKFLRNKYKVHNINDLYQADLNDMRSLSKFNDGYKYILTVLDVFSRFGMAIPIIDKKPTTIISAFKKIFHDSKRIPMYLQTDKGSEFIASSVRRFLREYDIKYYVAQNPDVKACFVERFNRTLKSRMFRYFTRNNTYRYIDVLSQLLNAYNSTVHSSIKMAPKDVNDRNILQVWRNQYGNNRKMKNILPKLKIGDTVRISREKHVFEKGYTGNWSEEIFKIKTVIKRHPPVYRLEDLNKENIEGVFYEPELQKVYLNPDDIFQIDKIIDTKGSGNKKKVLVKWKGYNDKFNSWISAKNIKHLSNIV